MDKIGKKCLHPDTTGRKICMGKESCLRMIQNILNGKTEGSMFDTYKGAMNCEGGGEEISVEDLSDGIIRKVQKEVSKE